MPRKTKADEYIESHAPGADEFVRHWLKTTDLDDIETLDPQFVTGALRMCAHQASHRDDDVCFGDREYSVVEIGRLAANVAFLTYKTFERFLRDTIIRI